MQVTYIDLSDNELTGVPTCLLELPNLAELDLSHNKVTNFPDIPKWPLTLKEINLSNNLLSFLPMNITAPVLNSLNLSKNQFSQVPLCICSFTTLTMLDLSNNPNIRALPLELDMLEWTKEIERAIEGHSELSSAVYPLFTRQA